MSKKYRQIMDKVIVTPEMEAKILHNIKEQMDSHNQAPTQKNKQRSRQVRGLLSIAACVLLLVGISLVVQQNRGVQQEPPLDVVSPYVEYPTLEQMQQALPFELKAPTSIPQGYRESEYLIFLEETAQIVYQNGENTLTFSMTQNGEDFWQEDADTLQQTQVESEGVVYELQGEDGLYSIIAWGDGNFRYSLMTDMPQPQDFLLGGAQSVQ